MKAAKAKCSECLQAIQLPAPAEELLELSKFTTAKEYTMHSLTHPTVTAYKLIEAAESIFLH